MLDIIFGTDRYRHIDFNVLFISHPPSQSFLACVAGAQKLWAQYILGCARETRDMRDGASSPLACLSCAPLFFTALVTQARVFQIYQGRWQRGLFLNATFFLVYSVVEINFTHGQNKLYCLFCFSVAGGGNYHSSNVYFLFTVVVSS